MRIWDGTSKGGNVEDLAEKMDYAFNHKDEVKERSKNALKAVPRFDGREVAKQFEQIYFEMLEKKKKGYYVPGGERRAKKYLKSLK